MGFSCVTGMRGRMPSADAERAIDAIRETLIAHTRKDGVWFDSRAWIVSARRPEA